MSDTVNPVGENPRPKRIHHVGSVAKFKYESIDNSDGYTGIFESGSDHGIIRLSVVKEPNEHMSCPYKLNFVPGVAMKFLKNGVPSSNSHLMFKADGSYSWNYFGVNFTNSIPPSPRKILHFVEWVFSGASPVSSRLGLSEHASYDKFGNKAEKPKFPFDIVLVSPLQHSYPDEFNEYFQDTLAKIPED